METVLYTKATLHQFIHSSLFDSLENIPISRHRAVSHIRNPRAGDEDVLLIVQYDGDKTAGYLGVLPDFVYLDREREKVGWLTCFWVDTAYRDRHVASVLFLEVIKAWDKKLFITNIVPWLEPVYQKTRLFHSTQFLTGFRGYMRFSLAEILPPKKEIFSKMKPLFKVVDSVLNVFSGIRFLFSGKYNLTGIRYEYLSSFDDIPDVFFEGYNDRLWNRRGKEELNWIINNPWILEGARKDCSSTRYYFTSLSKRFFYQIVKITNEEGQIRGVALFLVRDGNLTVPYVFGDMDVMHDISQIMVNTMLDLRLNMVTVFNSGLLLTLSRLKAPFLFKKEIRRPYFLPKKVDGIKQLNFQDGDGDCAFY